MQEPSVLDYLKSKIAPWKYPPVKLGDKKAGQSTPLKPPADQTDEQEAEIAFDRQSSVVQPQVSHKSSWPWRALAGLLTALVAQFSLEARPDRSWHTGVFLYLVAAGLITWSILRKEWQVASPQEDEPVKHPLTVKIVPFILGLVLAILTFLMSGGNRFTWVNVALLVLSIGLLGFAFWQPGNKSWRKQIATGWEKATSKAWWKSNWWWVSVTTGVVVLATIYRFANLTQIPPEMNSDHAEKILDSLRVTLGQTLIFFPNNGGREPLQMYLVAGLNQIFGVELNFTAIKIVSTTAGFLSLPFIYLTGKEIANRRVGLLAMALAGVAYWPNVVSRLGLRLPFYILFTSAFIYLLLHGLRSKQRNSFILGGIVLGASFYGYSANRILPLLLLVAVGIYLLHKRDASVRQHIIACSILLALFTGVTAIPLIRFTLEQPDVFLYRTLSRMSNLEQPLSGPAVILFLQNLGRALAMFSWSNGSVWTVSIPYRPALEVGSGALFWCGAWLMGVTYIQKTPLAAFIPAGIDSHIDAAIHTLTGVPD